MSVGDQLVGGRVDRPLTDRELQQMIESDRFCLDVVHQGEAAVAALREVSGIALESHLDAWAHDAAQGKSTPADLKDIAALLRRRLR